MISFIMKEKAPLKNLENLLKSLAFPVELQAAILNFFGGHNIVLKSGERKKNIIS